MKLFLTAVFLISSIVIFAQDTDNDGLSDFDEVNTYGTNPSDDDTDEDGIMDGSEVFTFGTNPLICDTDSDGLPDGLEVGLSVPQGVNTNTMSGCYISDSNTATTTNPLTADTDNDGISDGNEDADHDGNVDALETDPNDADTDGGGISDGEELIYGYNPLDPNDDEPCVDYDSDGICEGLDIDDDGDGVLDVDDADPLNEFVCQDLDGDGCDDCSFTGMSGFPDPSNDGVDLDADGFCVNMDCNDNDPNEFPGQVWYPDCDGDGYYSSVGITSCVTPMSPCADAMSPDGGYTHIAPANPDCDDNDANNYPGNQEVCDGQDNDCDGLVDDDDPDVIGSSIFYFDADGDGYGDPNVIIISCTLPANYVTNNLDCDDVDGNVNPASIEITCDGIDNDCDPSTPDDLDLDGDGYTVCGGDCDDSDDQINPGMGEITCDGKDNDCNPSTADAPDADNDGYSLCSGDCDDSNDQINPGMTEYGCDGIDNDCNISTSDILTIDVSITNSGMLIVANNTSADSYQWIDCLNTNQAISGANSSSFLATVAGEYAVIINVDECSDTSVCILLSDVGFNEFSTVYLALYPNPVQSELYIKYEGELLSVQLFDITGREVLFVTDLGEKVVYTGKLETGEYLVLIKTAEGYTLNSKILIQR